MLYKAKTDYDSGVFKAPKTGKKILGYELVQEYFVDNSGLGSPNEPAWTAKGFLSKVRAGYYYGITDVGQFQVYVGEFKKIDRKMQFKQLGIIKSKKIMNNTRLTEYEDGRRVLTLHQTDIITWIGDKIILNTGGWDTMTTRARFNQFLPPQVRVYRHKGETIVNCCGGLARFKDGMDIHNTTYYKVLPKK